MPNIDFDRILRDEFLRKIDIEQNKKHARENGATNNKKKLK